MKGLEGTMTDIAWKGDDAEVRAPLGVGALVLVFIKDGLVLRGYPTRLRKCSRKE
jgi:hypothetical protein